MLEILNRARSNPQAEANRLLRGDLNEGLPSGTISTAASQPLAFNLNLFQAAQGHSQWMLANNRFSHTGAGGSQISTRITNTGYSWSNFGENIAWGGTSGTPNLTTETAQRHEDLFIDDNYSGRGHRVSMMSPTYREIGISTLAGAYQGYNSVLVTQDFGRDSGTNAFLTGVVYTDRVANDDFYTVGEGLGNITVNAAGNGQTFSTTSLSSGGYSLRLAPGTYSVTFGGDFNNDGIVDSSIARAVTIGSENLKQDFATDTQFIAGSNVPISNVKNDFNGDKKSDILWRNNDGSVAVWQMNGATQTSGSTIANVTTDWKIAGTGDFGGDGKSDILWRNDNGSVALWQMNGATKTSGTIVANVTTDWKIAGTADFSGDGKSDILWRNDNGSIALWKMDGATVLSTSLTSISSVDNSWKIAGTGDFNGDSKSDILWRNDNGATSIWNMDGATVLSAGLTSTPIVDLSWKIAAPII